MYNSGNALDNAVTAAGQYEGKRFIEVATEKKYDMLLITVDNSLMEYYSRKMGKFTQKNGETNRKESAFFPWKNCVKNTAESVASKRSATGFR